MSYWCYEVPSSTYCIWGLGVQPHCLYMFSRSERHKFVYGYKEKLLPLIAETNVCQSNPLALYWFMICLLKS